MRKESNYLTIEEYKLGSLDDLLGTQKLSNYLTIEEYKPRSIIK